ncbi:MAG: RsmG family class I SAM-dependent methyltransferase, partial [Lachnospiraceae bacterium]
EDLSRDKAYREKYDLVCPRAVADLRTLSEYCLPFTKVGGTFVAYKSAEADEEISSAAHAIKTLGGKSAETDKFELGDSGMGRTLVRVDKTKLTSLKYPRKAGTPQKEPL